MSQINTKIIGLKEFRINVSALWKNARKNNVRYIVMHHSEPVFEMNPIKKKKLDDIVFKARAEYYSGKTKSFKNAKELIKDLNL